MSTEQCKEASSGIPLSNPTLEEKPTYIIGREGAIQLGNPASGLNLVHLRPESLAPQTFGKLIRSLKATEHTAEASRKNSDRLGAKFGEDVRLEAYARIELNHKACIDRLMQIPGIDELRMLCDWHQRPFDACSLAFLRAKLCISAGMSPAEADALPILSAARRLRAVAMVGEADGQRSRSTDLTKAVDETKTKGFLEWAGGPDVTLAIVFTDVVGSTALNEELGDAQMSQVRIAHFNQGRRLLQQYGGREIKTIGDSFMTAFRSVTTALDFALAFHSQTGQSRLSIRVAGPTHLIP